MKRINEIINEITVNNAFKFTQLTCNVISNCITNTTTVNLRANAGNTGVALSIGSNTTGIFTDNTHPYTTDATDAMNYQIVTSKW